jgi:hypothetical protein
MKYTVQCMYIEHIIVNKLTKGSALAMPYTANEGPVRNQYKCLVPIYVFPEMKLCSLVISKTEL